VTRTRESRFREVRRGTHLVSVTPSAPGTGGAAVGRDLARHDGYFPRRSSELSLPLSHVANGQRAGMTDDVQDDVEPDEAESETDDDFDRAPQPGNTPARAPERPLFDPGADDREDQ